jgi:protein-S-isoprenylcysteine O-methyltransferase Ste14
MKVITLVVALCIVYVPPLASTPKAIVSPPLVLAALGGALLLYLQPSISKDEVREHRSSDRHSATLILSAGVLVHILPVVEWRLRGFPWPRTEQIVGLILLTAGIAFRCYAIRILGPFFTATVRVQVGQSLVARGPYCKIRHPSYLGALIAIEGHALLLDASIAAVVAIVLMFFVYRRRIALEEAALLEGLGAQYREYQSRTQRLVPGLW